MACRPEGEPRGAAGGGIGQGELGMATSFHHGQSHTHVWA